MDVALLLLGTGVVNLQSANSTEVPVNETKTEDDYLIEKGVLNSWLHYLKLLLILVKVVIICYMLVEAILARLRKYGGKYDQLTIMFACLIIILIAIIAFDVGTKYIAGFYILVFFSNFINFLGMSYLVRKLKTPERKLLRRKTNFYFLVMNLLYMVCFVMSFTNEYGPWCTSTNLYPPVMNYATVLFFFNAAFHTYMHYKNYWLRWEKHPRLQHILGHEEELGWEPIAKLRPMFEAQMKVFLIFQYIICSILLMIHLMVHFYVDRRNFLGCSKDGFEWIYLTVEGSMFLLLHMACICLQAIMTEKVFYSVPKDFGYFDGLKDEDELESVPEDAPYMIKHAVKGYPKGSRLNTNESDDDYRSQHSKK